MWLSACQFKESARSLSERPIGPGNPDTFRKTFACLLRKAGVDTMTIKVLGRWESLEMAQRYTRSVTFDDSMKHYKAPLSDHRQWTHGAVGRGRLWCSFFRSRVKAQGITNLPV